MRQILTLHFLLIITCYANAQQVTFQKPDYDLIKKEIQDSASNFYYPALMSRLVQFDTTLNLEDYRRLYYGYIFQKNYEPYWSSPDENKLLEFYRSEKIKENDYDKIIKLATHSIGEFPFDIRPINFLGYVYHLKGNDEMAKKVSYRFQSLLKTIMSSGDGKTCENGYHVISVSHEYVLLNIFRFQMKQQSLIGHCDYLEFEKDERNVEGLYFNIEKLLAKSSEKFQRK
jgi:hypothetical protein